MSPIIEYVKNAMQTAKPAPAWQPLAPLALRHSTSVHPPSVLLLVPLRNGETTGPELAIVLALTQMNTATCSIKEFAKPATQTA